MTRVAQGDDIGRIEYPCSVVLDEDDVMHIKQIGFFKLIRNKAAILAGKIIPVHDGESELGIRFVAALAPQFTSKLLSKCSMIKIVSKPVGVLFMVIIPVSRSGNPLSRDRLAGLFRNTLVPRGRRTGLILPAIGMMTALVFGNAQAFTFPLVVYGEGSEGLAAAALAGSGDTLALSFGNTHRSILPEAGKLEKDVNCWDTLRASFTTAWPVTASANVEKKEDWAISSQAAEESVEGSTTRLWSPDRTVKAHECIPRKGRYSLVLRETVRSMGLNAPALTTRPYTGKLDDLSYHPVKKVVGKTLKHDAKKAFDNAAHAQFDGCLLRVCPLTKTSTSALNTVGVDGTCTETNNVAFGKDHAKAVVDYMKERDIPPYADDDYYALAWPSTLRTFKNNLESIYQYSDPGFGMIQNGEIGRYENIRFCEQTHIPKGGAADSTIWNSGTGTPDAWDNAKSDWIFFMGEDTVAEGISNPEEIRGKIPTDFGRSKGIALYYIGGFGIVHTTAAESRIVKWDSAV